MRSFVLFGALVACVAAQQQFQQRATTGNQYVFDILRPQLDAGQVVDVLLTAQAGRDYPNYADIPQTNFQCPQAPGFYADVNAQCQVFHRCDINGNQTSYLCVNTTVFNQITLVCDYFWNVDCQGYQQFVNFANSRLYTDLPLFDTPPADYVAPSQLLAQQQQEQLNGQVATSAQGSAQAGGAQTAGTQAGRNQNQGGRAQGTRIQIQTQGGRTQTQAARVQGQGGRAVPARAGAIGTTTNNANQQTGNLQAGSQQQFGAQAQTTTNQQQGAATGADQTQQGGVDQTQQGGAADQTQQAGAADQTQQGGAVNVQLSGANGSTAQTQLAPGQAATLNAGTGRSLTATNDNNGNLQVTSEQTDQGATADQTAQQTSQ